MQAHVVALRGGPAAPQRERARAGALAVLWAWLLFTIAGLVVQRVAEHWQGAVPAASRSLPSAAFGCLEIAAGIGAAAVIAGIAAGTPSAITFLRAGGLAEIRPAVQRSALITLAWAAVLALVVLRASQLTAPQRNGGDAGYEIAFVLLAASTICALAAWTATAACIARRADPAPAVLRFQALAGAVAAAAMGVVTVAMVVWWLGAAGAAAGFLDGRSSALSASLLATTVVMLAATALAAAGARQALTATSAISA
jgi:hypothetical protein